MTKRQNIPSWAIEFIESRRCLQKILFASFFSSFALSEESRYKGEVLYDVNSVPTTNQALFFYEAEGTVSAAHTKSFALTRKICMNFQIIFHNTV